jgi:putative ABC transport system permease protein
LNLLENIKVAIRSIKSNLVRSLLTLLIIAVGITCLVGILAAIDIMLFSLSDNFNRIGANSFSIRPAYETLKSNRSGRRQRVGEEINFDMAMEFKDRYDYGGARVAIDTWCTSNATVKYKNEKTNPTVRVQGIDEKYLDVSSYKLSHGRNFTEIEVETGQAKAIIGMDIVNMLFDKKAETALNQIIHVGNIKYRVAGILESKGSSMGGSSDRRIFITLMNAKRYYGYADKRYNIAASVSNSIDIDDATSMAIGVMRNVRKLKASQENDFEIRKSDSVLNALKDATSKLRIGTLAIVMMTLLGAAIGLMNIMLVTVTERTKEIGVTKAIGASRRNILIQFLTEAVVICLLGGFLGILLGTGVGIAVAVISSGTFVFPTAWIILALLVCVIVGVVSGIYPALKASRLDPIEALRYE